jgi:hypothetical protein
VRRRAAGAAAALLLVGAAAGGCGGKQQKSATNALTWEKAGPAYKPPNLPTDRVLLAHVRNSSNAPVLLDASKLVVRDASGTVLKSTGRYIAGYAHGLYGAFQKPSELPPQELTRLGYRITLAPGKSAPLAVAWRLRSGSKEPATVNYGSGTLTLPRGSTPGS